MPEPSRATEIVLLAGPVRPHGPVGHHDYAAGSRLLADMLGRLAGVRATVVDNGWPEDERLLDYASAIVIYDGGNGKQSFLREQARLAKLQEVIGQGAGLVMLHQAIAFPAAYRRLGAQWLGGAYVAGQSRRGHWKATHERLPSHPVTRGVAPWTIRDGWLKGIQFEADAFRITPILWSGERYRGAPEGGDQDIVAWLYARGDGGRSFAFTGLDAHRAWRHDGLRRLIANGVVWASGLEPPADVHWTEMAPARIAAYTTPRRSRLIHEIKKIRRIARPGRRW